MSPVDVKARYYIHTVSWPAREGKIRGLVYARVVFIWDVILRTGTYKFSFSLYRQTRGVSEDAMSFCSWLKDSQLKRCLAQPLLGLSARDGVELALKECRSQFTDRRWNCSGVTIADVFQNERMLKAGKLQIHAQSKLHFLYFIQHTTKSNPSSVFPLSDLPRYSTILI